MNIGLRLLRVTNAEEDPVILLGVTMDATKASLEANDIMDVFDLFGLRVTKEHLKNAEYMTTKPVEGLKTDWRVLMRNLKASQSYKQFDSTGFIAAQNSTNLHPSEIVIDTIFYLDKTDVPHRGFSIGKNLFTEAGELTKSAVAVRSPFLSNLKQFSDLLGKCDLRYPSRYTKAEVDATYAKVEALAYWKYDVLTRCQNLDLELEKNRGHVPPQTIICKNVAELPKRLTWYSGGE